MCAVDNPRNPFSLNPLDWITPRVAEGSEFKYGSFFNIFSDKDDPVPGLEVTYYDIPSIESHLNTIARWEGLSPNDQDPERAMLDRLKNNKKTKSDFEFYMHERIEADLMRTKYNNVYSNENLAKAHQEALKIRNVAPHEIWHPSVLKKHKEYFPSHYDQYWKK